MVSQYILIQIMHSFCCVHIYPTQYVCIIYYYYYPNHFFIKCIFAFVIFIVLSLLSIFLIDSAISEFFYFYLVIIITVELFQNDFCKHISSTRYTDTILLILFCEYITVRTFDIILVSINNRKVSEKNIFKCN